MTTTDFFDRQDNARRLTRRLVWLFALAVAAIIVAIYFALAGALIYANANEQVGHIVHGWNAERMANGELPRQVHSALTIWQPELFLWVAVGTILVVGAASLFKIAELSAGGEQVALMMGGRAVNPQTADPAERRLLNVVEEMALASGVPVPPVFILDNEPSINAFAAGHQPGDAVVAVSAGCLQYLTREELQGVMGHEFSHILNGDMRLNLRLIGVVYGILVLAILGYYILRSAPYATSSRKEGGGIGLALAVVGLVMLVLGYLGVFFGNLIKAAISRQREFLADASSVQFTRQPGGLAGALKKIGGLVDGSRIRDAHAPEISHMFFGDAFAGSFLNLFATHPPLADRIRAIDPTFDGEFSRVGRAAEFAAAESGTPMFAPRRPGLAAALGGIAAMVEPMPTEAPPERAVVQAMKAGPGELTVAAHEPFSAQALVYALLLSREDAAVREQQMATLGSKISFPLLHETQRLADVAQSLPPEGRLPLVDLAVPALKQASAQQYTQFRHVAKLLIQADGTLDLFEYCLGMVLFSYLDVHFGLAKSPSARHRTTAAVARPLTTVLSTLAHAGHPGTEDAQRAFQAGIAGRLAQAELLPPDQCNLHSFDAALAELAQTTPNVKRDILAAVTACIKDDGRFTVQENELLRAIAAVLACPVPPM